MIVKTDTLQIRILELIGLLGEATSDENKCFSKAICISFAAVQTKMFSDENTPLKDKSVMLIADPADYADGNIKPEKYSSMEIKGQEMLLYAKITVDNLVKRIILCYNNTK